MPQTEPRAYRCTYSQAGSFGHECGRPATLMGTFKAICEWLDDWTARMQGAFGGRK